MKPVAQNFDIFPRGVFVSWVAEGSSTVPNNVTRFVNVRKLAFRAGHQHKVKSWTFNQALAYVKSL